MGRCLHGGQGGPSKTGESLFVRVTPQGSNHCVDFRFEVLLEMFRNRANQKDTCLLSPAPNRCGNGSNERAGQHRISNPKRKLRQ